MKNENSETLFKYLFIYFILLYFFSEVIKLIKLIE